MSAYAVIAENVSKIYKMHNKQDEHLKDLLFRKRDVESFFALKGVTFSVEAGKSIGLVGLNGSGKSTLANIIAQVSEPSAGRLQVNGMPTLIAIGAGLNNQLTGRENIEYKGLLIGLTPKQIGELADDIIDFADIDDFIDQPVKTYSSGMRARLGFAISININPDILVIDEALSVGDPSFTQKCLDKMNHFREQGKTVFFVSHSISQVEEFCTEVMWLEFGILKAFGDAKDVLPMYRRFLYDYNKMDKLGQKAYKIQALQAQAEFLKGNNGI